MGSAVTLIAAFLGAVGTIIAAIITTRRAGPAGAVTVSSTEVTPGHGWDGPPSAGAVVVASVRTSKAFWLGLASLVLWVIPLLGYCVIIPGLWVGIREMNGPRKRTTAGVVMCGIGLFLALINSAIGAYQGAHGQLWFQQ